MDINEKHRQSFIDLVNARFFDVRGGQAVVDFDGEGNIMQVKVNYPTFRRIVNSGTVAFNVQYVKIETIKP